MRTMKEQQVKIGIQNGFNENVKLSEFLLSVPILFAAFTDPRRGPSLARAVVSIVGDSDNDWMEYQFDDTWGKYDANNDTDKSMMDLIIDDQANVCHYFRQFGFGSACMEMDL